MIIDQEDYITHHAFISHYGVKGMKWGVVNEDKRSGRRSAREEKKTNRREAKAKKFDEKAKAAQAELNKINASPNKHSIKNSLAKKDLQKIKVKSEANAKAVREGKLTSGQKKALVGAGVATALVATYGTYIAVDSGEFNRSMMKGKAFLTGKQGLPWNKNIMLTKKNMSVDDIERFVVPQINPGYSTGHIGARMNCRRCTYAYEMRRRGYDVEATKTLTARGQHIFGTINANAPTDDLITNKYEGLYKLAKEKAKFEEAGVPSGTRFAQGLATYSDVGQNVIKLGSSGRSAGDEVFDAIIRGNPNGARGELNFLWSFGGGHSIAWEIVNGRPVVFDTQSGKKFMSGTELMREFGSAISEAGYTRLDNLPLNDDFLMRWLKNA